MQGGIRCLALLAVSFGVAASSLAGDWPQILGPSRDGRAVDETLPDRWPAGGPKTVWSVPAGEGFAGPAIADGKVVFFHRVQGNEQVDALDVSTGKPAWNRTFPASYRGGVNADRGPRCVPTIVGDRAYLFGAAGDLRCVSLKTGEPLWSRALYEDYEGDLGYFGAGTSPLVVQDSVLVNVGGRNAGIVAVSTEDGATKWKATQEGASYASPIAYQDAGQTRVVFVTRLNAVLLDPRDGRVIQSIDFGKRGPTVNAATPLRFDQRLFLTASYGIGARMLKLEKDQWEPIWSNDTSMSSQYATSVYRSGYLYGIHGREDVDADLRCVEASTGKVAWSVNNFGVAHLILAGDKLLVLANSGELTLARASEKKFDVIGKSRVASATIRALPAISNGRVFFRTNDSGESKLYALAWE